MWEIGGEAPPMYAELFSLTFPCIFLDLCTLLLPWVYPGSFATPPEGGPPVDLFGVVPGFVGLTKQFIWLCRVT